LNNIEEIKKALSGLKNELHERYGVSNIEVFGSYVRGEQRDDSDLDVLVQFDRDVDLLEVSGLRIMLCERLQMEVDVVLKRSVRKELKDVIFKEAIAV
jgi:uncharacterized protein